MDETSQKQNQERSTSAAWGKEADSQGLLLGFTNVKERKSPLRTLYFPASRPHLGCMPVLKQSSPEAKDWKTGSIPHIIISTNRRGFVRGVSDSPEVPRERLTGCNAGRVCGKGTLSLKGIWI